MPHDRYETTSKRVHPACSHFRRTDNTSLPHLLCNAKLRNRIVAGEVRQDEARRLEKNCLVSLVRFDRGECPASDVVDALCAYERVHDGKSDRREVYREVLHESPWKKCPCEICTRLGIHGMLFRGADRNRRRGFHNLFVFFRRLCRETGRLTPPQEVR